MEKENESFNLMFENCYISCESAERVAQAITSIHDPSFREEIPVPKYVYGTVTICDGYSSKTLTFHSTKFNIKKTLEKS